MYYFCTYFDKNYLDKGLALYRSLTRTCRPFTLWILCLDEETHRIFSDMQLPYMHPIPINTFEEMEPGLFRTKGTRSTIEYYFTCTPVLARHLLQNHPDIDILTYLDADLYFFQSIGPAYEEMRHGSVLIVGHRFPRNLKHLERYGVYNVGLLSFRNDKTGMACVKWWENQCLEWCYDREEGGKYADQKYLDDWQERFTRVVSLKNTGIGLAPWNIADYSGQPVIMYHFAGLKEVIPGLWESGVYHYNCRLTKKCSDTIYAPYVKELDSCKEELEKYGWKKEFADTRIPSVPAMIRNRIKGFWYGKSEF